MCIQKIHITFFIVLSKRNKFYRCLYFCHCPCLDRVLCMYILCPTIPPWFECIPLLENMLNQQTYWPNDIWLSCVTKLMWDLKRSNNRYHEPLIWFCTDSVQNFRDKYMMYNRWWINFLMQPYIRWNWRLIDITRYHHRCFKYFTIKMKFGIVIQFRF